MSCILKIRAASLVCCDQVNGEGRDRLHGMMMKGVFLLVGRAKMRREGRCVRVASTKKLAGNSQMALVRWPCLVKELRWVSCGRQGCMLLQAVPSSGGILRIVKIWGIAAN